MATEELNTGLITFPSEAYTTSRTDTVTANGSTTVADTSAATGDVGKLVLFVGGSGAIPAGTTVASVVAGTSFTASSPIPSGVTSVMIASPATGLTRWRAVDIDANGAVTYPSGSTGRIVGVIQAPTFAGQAATVCLISHGISRVESGGAIAVGASVGVDNVGRAVSGHAGLGVALDACAAAGQIIRVLLTASALS